MKKLFTGLLVLTLGLAGCGGPTPETEAEMATEETDSSTIVNDHGVTMGKFAPVTIGPYEVQPLFEEEIGDGHYSFEITGAEFNAVRIWAGTEDPGDVMVVKTEDEHQYQHGHLDIPNPIPAGVELWIEIEDTEGNTHKGSTPIKLMS